MNSRLRAFMALSLFVCRKRGTVAAIIKFVGDGQDRPLLLKPPLTHDSALGEVSALLTEGSRFPSAQFFRNDRRGGPVCPPARTGRMFT